MHVYDSFQSTLPLVRHDDGLGVADAEELAAAFRANAAGALLGAMAAASVPWLLISAARGRWLPGTPGLIAMSAMAVAVTLIALVQWGWRLLGG